MRTGVGRSEVRGKHEDWGGEVRGLPGRWRWEAAQRTCPAGILSARPNPDFKEMRTAISDSSE